MNIQNLMMQAQKMQKEMNKKNKEFDDKEFEFGYQNDSIKVKLKGNLKIINISIIDALIDIDDKITLEEMVSEAINYAIEKVSSEKEKITSSMMPKGMPGLF